MAKQDKEKKLKDLSNKSSLALYSMDNTLADEEISVRNIIKQTIVSTKEKYSSKANGKIVDYFNELNFGATFADAFASAKEDKNAFKNNPEKSFKKFFTDNGIVDAGALLAGDMTRLQAYTNYEVIFNHIPECAQALEVFKDNIMSPDDFTKMIFDIFYDDETDDAAKKKIEKDLDNIKEKYNVEDYVDQILEKSLLYGDYYVAILSLENELGNLLGDGVTLNENNAALFDPSCAEVVVNPSDIHSTIELNEAVAEYYGYSGDDIKSSEDTDSFLAQLINENIKIGSKKELLIERNLADTDSRKNDIGTGLSLYNSSNKKKEKKKKEDSKPLYVNGSVIKLLEPRKVIDLKIDNISYGSLYVVEATNTAANNTYLGVSSGRSITGNLSVAQNNTISGTTAATYTPQNQAAKQFGISDQKMQLIANVFINNIAKKIDKDFIRHNKEFKNFVYELLQQDYIMKKGVKIIYFPPGEVIHFECPAIYRKIVFFAKLYLSMLSNDVLIKLGRAHDKRVFYINVGVDDDYEQAVSKVIADIKTKEYSMNNIGDFNTILSLNPGRWDDYFMPVINGDRPVEIDTLAGMDTDLNSDFMDYLKNSMLNGIGVPRALIDSMNDLDFARVLSTQNANFVRSVIRYQKKLTEPFSLMFRRLYKNEYQYNNNSENESMKLIDINAIKIKFPSPATLNMSNMSDQINAIEGNADFISSQLIPPKADGSNEDIRVKLKSKIVQDLMPGIDWEKYEAFKEEINADGAYEMIANPPPPADDMGMGGY